MNEAVILWASYFDELAVISFAHEFRQMGVPTTIVPLHSTEDDRSSVLLNHSHQSLADAVARAGQVSCLVIPTSATALGQFQQDPLLWELVNTVHSNGGRIVMGRSEGRVDSEIAHLLPSPLRSIFYPQPEKLLIFARSLAYGLSNGDGLKADGASNGMPPLIRVANGSDPVKVAGAMAGIVREYGFAESQSVGAGAGNQMLKAIAITKSYLAADKLSLFVVPDFATVQISGLPRSAIKLFLSAWPTQMDNSIGWAHMRSQMADDD